MMKKLLPKPAALLTRNMLKSLYCIPDEELYISNIMWVSIHAVMKLPTNTRPLTLLSPL